MPPRSTKRKTAARSSPAPRKPKPKPKARPKKKVVAVTAAPLTLEERVKAIEDRLGIDHEVIAADRAASLRAGADAAALSEAPAGEDA